MKKLPLLLFAAFTLVSCTQAEMEVRSKGIVLRDHTVIHYLEAGQGPVLILVHGLGSSSEVWRDALPHLSRAYRVIALDLPGYGKSDKPRIEYSIEYYVAALNAFIGSLGAGKVTLVGNSMGGWIAALTAADNPQSVSHLILVDSAGLRSDTPPSVNLNPATQAEYQTLLDTFFDDTSLVSEAMVVEQWKYRKSIQRTVQSTLESLKTKGPPLDKRLKDIQTPTLIIWGRQDTVIPLVTANRFASGIRNAKLVIIHNAGHLPHVEKPREFSRAVKRFVKSW